MRIPVLKSKREFKTVFDELAQMTFLTPPFSAVYKLLKPRQLHSTACRDLLYPQKERDRDGDEEIDKDRDRVTKETETAGKKETQ